MLPHQIPALDAKLKVEKLTRKISIFNAIIFI